MSSTLKRRTFLGAAGAAGLARSGSDTPALLGGEPVRRKPFPSWPRIGAKDEANWMEALRACKWWRREGHWVRDFEKAWGEKLGVRHVVATANGTGALMAAMSALEIGPKDEVLTTPYTFIATINAILAQYALPVFVDTDRATHMIDATKIEAAITPRTRAIMPVHLGGNMADMDKILEISRRRGIAVIEDACQAHLSAWRGKAAGTLGELGCFSFQKFKNLPGGEAGAVVTNDEKLYLHAYGFHSHYRTPGENAPDLPICRNGINLRLAEFQAALLVAQMERLEETTRRREENAALLGRLLGEIPGIEPVKQYPGCTRNGYHLYMMRYDAEAFAGLPRSRLIEAVRAEGIPLAEGYGPLNRHPFLENTARARMFRAIYTERELAGWRERNRHLPANDLVTQESLWFSQNILLGERRDMEDIAAAFAKVRRHAEKLKAS